MTNTNQILRQIKMTNQSHPDCSLMLMMNRPNKTNIIKRQIQNKRVFKWQIQNKCVFKWQIQIKGHQTTNTKQTFLQTTNTKQMCVQPTNAKQKYLHMTNTDQRISNDKYKSNAHPPDRRPRKFICSANDFSWPPARGVGKSDNDGFQLDLLT